jgi:hypothetical protein
VDHVSRVSCPLHVALFDQFSTSIHDIRQEQHLLVDMEAIQPEEFLASLIQCFEQ